MIDLSQNFLCHALHQYGSIALFFMLAVGIIGLPIPDETLLLSSGFFAAKGVVAVPAIFFAGLLGSWSGISVSFFLGRSLGHHFAIRYGKYIWITETKLQNAHNWFEKTGKYFLLIGYFIPGVRHVTGFIAGTTELEFKIFALYAYLGATLWVIIFFSGGYFFFHEIQHLFPG